MKVRVWVATDKVGSKCQRVVDVPDEDVEGLTEDELTRLLDEWMRDELAMLMEWGWEIV